MSEPTLTQVEDLGLPPIVETIHVIFPVVLPSGDTANKGDTVNLHEGGQVTIVTPTRISIYPPSESFTGTFFLKE